MNLKDALAAFQFGKKKQEPHKLSTPWGETLDRKIILGQYPRPQLQRESWVNLNGYWNYAFTKEENRPLRFDGKILVPFSPEASLSEVGRQLQPDEYLWYSRTVSLAKLPKNKRLILHFGAVDQDCMIYWNGEQACSHTGGYLSFQIDVTKHLQIGKNTLWVMVQDETGRSWKNRGKQKRKPGGMFYTAQSGIWQTVWMEWVPDAYIQSLHITPHFAGSYVTMSFQCSKPLEKKISIYAEGVLLFEDTVRENHSSISLNEIHPWSPEDPFLYDVEICAGKDRITSYFAMRDFSCQKDEHGIPRLFLNGRPYFQNGILDQGYWPDGLYTAPSEDALLYDIMKMKSLGFNMIRKHLKIEPARWYYLCDKLGMIVWQDMINGGGRSLMAFLCYLPTTLPFVATRFSDHFYPLFSRTSKKGRQQWMKECKAAIDQLSHFPCIAMWVAFNEGWGQFDALEVASKIKDWDPTRLVDHASGWYDQGGGDIKSVHNYFRTPRVTLEARPFVLSEYGGLACRIPEHSYSNNIFGYQIFQDSKAYTEAYDKLQKHIRHLEDEGLAAAVYTQLSDVEEEVNGILTYDRKACKIQLGFFSERRK